MGATEDAASRRTGAPLGTSRLFRRVLRSFAACHVAPRDERGVLADAGRDVVERRRRPSPPEQRERGGRRRKLYAITDRGREALRLWRAEPTGEIAELRDQAILKLFFGADPAGLGPPQIEAHCAKLAEYEQIRASLADDVPRGVVTDFYKATQARDDETPIFSWIEYPDKATRDAANKQMMSDPSMANMEMPFDAKRMFWGGFEIIVDE